MNQMRTAFVVLVTLFAGVLSGTPQKSDQGEVLLQKAIHKETVEGKLEEAIQLYREVYTTSKNNRALAAKALVQMGQCYEKLGNAEARNAYEQVIKDFADQEEQVQAARTKLAALTAPEAKPKFTKIRVPTKLPRLTEMALSPNGQQLAYASDGDVWLMPVHGASDPGIAGAAHRITNVGRQWSSVHGTRWSNDSKWITFQAWERLPEGGEEPVIYMVASAGGDLKRIPLQLKNYIEEYWDHGLSLSPDGLTLAYLTYKEGETADQRRIYLAPTKGGPYQCLTPPGTREPAFSPDGKRLAYVGYVKVEGRSPDRPLGRQVWVISTDGAAPRLVYEMAKPGRLRNPIWSPDGSTLTFLTCPETDEATKLLFIRVKPDGRPGGSPAEIDLPSVTSEALLGWGADDSIGMLFNNPELTALYTVPVSGGKAAQITPSEAWMPSWTPDGSRIFFGSFDPKDPPIRLSSVPASGGKVTRVPINHDRPFAIQLPVGGISVSPDGSKVLFCAYYYKSTAKEPSRFFTVPINGGELTEVSTGMFWAYRPNWSPDGKSIVFIGGEEVPNKNDMLYSLYTMPLSGGKPRPVALPADKVMSCAGVAWSPDGKYIAYNSEDDKLKIVPAEGGPSKVLVEGLKGYRIDSGLAWSPNGKELAYITSEKIFRLNLESGKSDWVPTDLPEAHLMQLAWSPDGKTIAFSALQGGEPELWLMSDFLPLLKSAR